MNLINDKNINNVKLLNGHAITLNMIIEALNLDWRTYDEEYHLSERQVKDYLEKNPFIYFVAIIDNKLVGYINFSPVKKEMYEKIKSGMYIDTVIERDDILEYEDNNKYYIYFASIVVDKQYQGLGVGGRLIQEVRRFMANIEKERGIVIEKIIADVISEGGLKMVSKLGLKVIKDSNHNTKIAEWERDHEK